MSNKSKQKEIKNRSIVIAGRIARLFQRLFPGIEAPKAPQQARVIAEHFGLKMPELPEKYGTIIWVYNNLPPGTVAPIPGVQRSIESLFPPKQRPVAKVTPVTKKKVDNEAKLKEFYASWEWAALRYRAFQLYGRTCCLCGATKTDGVRIVMDHIQPIRLRWDLRLDISNLQPLCDPCNMGKSYKDQTDWRPKAAVDGDTPPF